MCHIYCYIIINVNLTENRHQAVSITIDKKLGSVFAIISEHLFKYDLRAFFEVLGRRVSVHNNVAYSGKKML